LTNKYFQPLALFLFLFILAALFNFRTLGEEKRIVWIRGETPSRANFAPNISRNGRFQQGESVELLSDSLPPTGHYSLLYKFRILKNGVYALFLAGTPPGATEPGKDTDWFSPYWVSLDSGPFKPFTDESFKKEFPVHPTYTEYVPGGYHWSRIAWLELAQGRHTIEIQIRDKRLKDGKYAFFLDSILLVPKDFKPKRVLKDLDPRFFT